jgi:hypothetical protein
MPTDHRQFRAVLIERRHFLGLAVPDEFPARIPALPSASFSGNRAVVMMSCQTSLPSITISAAAK